MGFGLLNIWIRNEDCSLINAWRADLEVKTCLGENIIDMLPQPDLDKITDHLKEMYPEATVSTGNYYWTKTIRVAYPYTKKFVNHLQVMLPPGSYVLRVHECGEGNEWSDRTMIVVGCGEELCVNLIIKRAESCINEVVIPLLRVVEEIHLPREQVQVAVDVLGKAGRIKINDIAEDLETRVKEFRGIEGATRAVNEAETGLKIIKDLRFRKEK